MAVDTATEPVVTVTDEALARIVELRDAEDEATPLVLRITVTGVDGPEYGYDLSFALPGDLGDDDVRYRAGDLEVAVPGGDVEALTGAVLDMRSQPGRGGLVIRNPNRPDPLAGLGIELSGDIAQKVSQLLEHSINPSLAGHGGVASLVRVEGSTVYLAMGGGCQGCAMSAVTMRQGIQATIMGAIPEVTDVVDATDHTGGANPFYS